MSRRAKRLLVTAVLVLMAVLAIGAGIRYHNEHAPRYTWIAAE